MNKDTHSELDQKTRANLAYIWSCAIIVMIGYALLQYGHVLAVLTLILGFASGTATTVLSVYFSATMGNKKGDQLQSPTVSQENEANIDQTKN